MSTKLIELIILGSADITGHSLLNNNDLMILSFLIVLVADLRFVKPFKAFIKDFMYMYACMYVCMYVSRKNMAVLLFDLDL